MHPSLLAVSASTTSRLPASHRGRQLRCFPSFLALYVFYMVDQTIALIRAASATLNKLSLAIWGSQTEELDTLAAALPELVCPALERLSLKERAFTSLAGLFHNALPGYFFTIKSFRDWATLRTILKDKRSLRELGQLKLDFSLKGYSYEETEDDPYTAIRLAADERCIKISLALDTDNEDLPTKSIVYCLRRRRQMLLTSTVYLPAVLSMHLQLIRTSHPTVYPSALVSTGYS